MVSTSQGLFVGLVLLVAIQRIWELRRSAAHEAAIRAAGGREHAPGQMAVMRVVHTTWLVAMLVEVIAFHRVFDARIAVPALIVFLAGQALRIAAMRALGERWTVTIMTLPGAAPVEHGIYRAVRHPNYVGVVLEIFALPLVHGGWLTSIVFTIANALLLRSRIAAEEKALTTDNHYDAVLANRPRFVPGLRT